MLREVATEDKMNETMKGVNFHCLEGERELALRA